MPTRAPPSLSPPPERSSASRKRGDIRSVTMPQPKVKSHSPNLSRPNDSNLNLYFTVASAYMFRLLYVPSYTVSEGTSSLSLDHAILGLLNERPRSGYDLKTRCFDGPLRPLWSADQAQIYRTLDRLERAGHVASRRKRQAGKPDRRIYEITHAGREALWEWLSAAAPLPPARDPFLLQLYFGAAVNDETLIRLLEDRRSSHQERLQELRSGAVTHASSEGASDRAAILRQTAFDGAITRERASVDWLDDCIEAAKEGALPGSEDGIGQRHLFGT